MKKSFITSGPGMFAQRRLKFACAFAQSDHILRWTHEETASLGGRGAGWATYPKRAQ